MYRVNKREGMTVYTRGGKTCVMTDSGSLFSTFNAIVYKVNSGQAALNPNLAAIQSNQSSYNKLVEAGQGIFGNYYLKD